MSSPRSGTSTSGKAYTTVNATNSPAAPSSDAGRLLAPADKAAPTEIQPRSIVVGAMQSFSGTATWFDTDRRELGKAPSIAGVSTQDKHVFARLDGVPWRPSTPEEWEIAMRSIAMLPPGHPGGLDKEGALHAVDEVRRLLARERELLAILRQLRSLLVNFDTEDR